jgi:hypothetical protein
LKLFASLTNMGQASEWLVAKALYHPLCHSTPGIQAADNHLCNIIINMIIFLE